MTNDEARMTKECTNDEILKGGRVDWRGRYEGWPAKSRAVQMVIGMSLRVISLAAILSGHLDFVILSSFVIGHSSFHLGVASDHAMAVRAASWANSSGPTNSLPHSTRCLRLPRRAALWSARTVATKAWHKQS